jgi:hypothetical protein
MKLANLHLVASVKDLLPHPMRVHVSAIERSGIDQGVAGPSSADLGMATRNGHIVKEDFGFWVATGNHNVSVEKIYLPRIGAPVDDQSSRREATRTFERHVDKRSIRQGGVEGNGEVIADGKQRLPARRAKIGFFGVLMATLAAKSVRHQLQPPIKAS